VRESSAVSTLEAAGVDLRYGDVNDPNSLLAAMQGVDTIIHTAAVVSFLPSERDLMLKVNGEGTANVVNMALEAGVRRLIHLSSVAALNRVDGGPVVTLADRWPAERPNTSYGESKFAAEREAWRGQAEGLEVAVLYPSLILGQGDFSGHNTTALWRMVAKERSFFPEGMTGVVSLADVVSATLEVLRRNKDGDRFLLNATNLSWEQLLTRIARSIDAKPPTVRMPAWQSAFLWPVEALRAKLSGSRPLITRESHRNVQASFRYDGSAYSKATGNAYRDIGTVIAEIGKKYKAEPGN
ncbi:MAG: NAD-dependent epimerase/dehydratase family protein, partial [Bacteroidota bacterium]